MSSVYLAPANYTYQDPDTGLFSNIQFLDETNFMASPGSIVVPGVLYVCSFMFNGLVGMGVAVFGDGVNGWQIQGTAGPEISNGTAYYNINLLPLNNQFPNFDAQELPGFSDADQSIGILQFAATKPKNNGQQTTIHLFGSGASKPNQIIHINRQFTTVPIKNLITVKIPHRGGL